MFFIFHVFLDDGWHSRVTFRNVGVSSVAFQFFYTEYRVSILSIIYYVSANIT